jgi:sigma-B regulation protein RsbU (phosphoserine phosphatase)
MKSAREIQQKMFPAAPRLENFDIGGACYPALLTGGDYFDFIPLPDGSLGVAVGDVSGHGFGPALLMASTRAYLRGLAQTHLDPSEVLARANRVLSADTGGEPFVTLLFARLDPRTRRLVYASAGHPTGYVTGSGGVVKERLESTGIPLGIFPEAEFDSSVVVNLEPGDTVLLLTDGVLEARAPNGVAFGEKRTLDTARVYHTDTARQLVSNLYHTVRAFSRNGPQQDDITAVTIKANLAA